MSDYDSKWPCSARGRARIGEQQRQRSAAERDDGDCLVGALPKGSSNSAANGRTNLAAFLEKGSVCPMGYAPGNREYFPRLLSEPGLRWIVGRPQDFAELAARSAVDFFIAFEDVVLEALEAGLTGVDLVMRLPFVSVHQVLAVREDAPFLDLGAWLARAATPIRCASELPFLASKALGGEDAYRQRFGLARPVIEKHGRALAGSDDRVRVTWSAGSCEPQVTADIFDCCMVARSTGKTLSQCRLRVIDIVGTYHPALFCRAGVREDPRLAGILAWLVNRLELATRRWREQRSGGAEA